MNPVRLLLADDDALVRSGLRVILGTEPDLEVVGEAADGDEAIAMAVELEPDLVVMDIRMPGTDGLTATRQLVAERDQRVLILTTFELDEYVYEAVRIGAVGFLLKRSPPEELVRAVRLAGSGDSLVVPASTRRLVETFAASSADADRYREGIERLTKREREVLAKVASGLSNDEIADELFVGRETIKSHVTSILTKLGARDRTQAVIAAYESGFVGR